MMTKKLMRYLEIMGLLAIVFIIDKLTSFEVTETTFLIALVTSLILNQQRGEA